MRSTRRLILFTLAAICWLAAGPGGATLQGMLACRHHAVHQSHPGHGATPADGPCFCDEMTGGSDVAVSTAVPTPPTPELTLTAPRAHPASRSRFPLPASPAFTPVPPPPIRPG
jgi:hypothetical protein